MIKNIIFDIGNVILKFSREYLLSNFYQGEDFEFLKEKIFHNWQLMDEDILTPKSHLEAVLSSLPIKYHNVAKGVLTTWEDYMILIDGIVDYIKELKENGYKLYVLSNMTTHFIENANKFPVLELFDGIVYSAPIKMVKPNPEIYRYILNKFNLIGSECVFIDDTEKNLVEATRFNIKTFHFKNNLNELKEFINSL